VSTIAAAPSSWISEASSSVSALPLLFPPAPPAARYPVLQCPFAQRKSRLARRPAVYRCHRILRESAVNSASDSAAKRNGFIL
jgi:hypothetical protein